MAIKSRTQEKTNKHVLFLIYRKGLRWFGYVLRRRLPPASSWGPPCQALWLSPPRRLPGSTGCRRDAGSLLSLYRAREGEDYPYVCTTGTACCSLCRGEGVSVDALYSFLSTTSRGGEGCSARIRQLSHRFSWAGTLEPSLHTSRELRGRTGTEREKHAQGVLAQSLYRCADGREGRHTHGAWSFPSLRKKADVLHSHQTWEIYVHFLL